MAQTQLNCVQLLPFVYVYLSTCVCISIYPYLSTHTGKTPSANRDLVGVVQKGGGGVVHATRIAGGCNWRGDSCISSTRTRRRNASSPPGGEYKRKGRGGGGRKEGTLRPSSWAASVSRVSNMGRRMSRESFTTPSSRSSLSVPVPANKHLRVWRPLTRCSRVAKAPHVSRRPGQRRA